MTIEKALWVLIRRSDVIGRNDDENFWDAYHLGIEALKHIQLMRSEPNPLEIHSLPGETKE